MTLSRHGNLILAILLTVLSAEAAAQDALARQAASPPERIDIGVRQDDESPAYEDCTDEQDAAEITGEIIVCRQRTGDENRLYDKESAERRHAARTQGPQPVDVAGAGIFRGPATLGGLCFIPPCPKDPVLLIDVAALPEAPPGSDADRIARGLAPRGNDTSAALAAQSPQIVREARLQDDAEQLGLPLPGDEGRDINPSGSASPEERPSG